MKLRFSLKTLGLILSLVCVLLGLLAMQHRALERELAIANLLITRYDAQVSRERENPYGDPLPCWDWSQWRNGRLYQPIVKVRISRHADEEALRIISRCRELTTLDLLNSEFTNVPLFSEPMPRLKVVHLRNIKLNLSHMEEIAALPALERLMLTYTELSDDLLVPLIKSQGLAELGLSDNPITDEGCRVLGQCRHLKMLGLENTDISNQGLVHLTACPALEMLYLRGTRINDEAVGTLAQFQRLNFLAVEGTEITDASVPQLMGMLSNNLRDITYGQTQFSDDGKKQLRAGMDNRPERNWPYGAY